MNFLWQTYLEEGVSSSSVMILFRDICSPHPFFWAIKETGETGETGKTGVVKTVSLGTRNESRTFLCKSVRWSEG